MAQPCNIEILDSMIKDQKNEYESKILSLENEIKKLKENKQFLEDYGLSKQLTDDEIKTMIRQILDEQENYGTVFYLRNLDNFHSLELSDLKDDKIKLFDLMDGKFVTMTITELSNNWKTFEIMKRLKLTWRN